MNQHLAFLRDYKDKPLRPPQQVRKRSQSEAEALENLLVAVIVEARLLPKGRAVTGDTVQLMPLSCRADKLDRSTHGVVRSTYPIDHGQRKTWARHVARELLGHTAVAV